MNMLSPGEKYLSDRWENADIQNLVLGCRDEKYPEISRFPNIL